jgi:predicted protein tyrosine phosphatase
MSHDHPKRRILFVCARGKCRSRTAEELYRNAPGLEVRSCGVRASARRQISASDLEWADRVYVMESSQKAWLRERFQDLPLPPIEVLDIPDDFEFMDPELIQNLTICLEADLGKPRG